MNPMVARIGLRPRLFIIRLSLTDSRDDPVIGAIVAIAEETSSFVRQQRTRVEHLVLVALITDAVDPGTDEVAEANGSS